MTVLGDNFDDSTPVRKVWVKPSFHTHFNPNEWEDPAVSKDCLSYGANIPEIGEGAIGNTGVIGFGEVDISSPEKVKAALKEFELEEHATLPQDGSHVMAVFWTPHAKGHGRPDFHVYRRDANEDGPYGNETWSHLYIEGSGCGAQGKPSQKDHSGNIITDPLTCDHGRDNYVFVGYFAFGYEVANIDSPGLQIVPKIDIDPEVFASAFTSHNNPVVKGQHDVKISGKPSLETIREAPKVAEAFT